MRLQRWHYRHSVFKAGFCGLLLALALCCIGFLAPAWQNSGGLWIHATLVQPLPGWFQAVRALATLSLVALGLGVMVEVYQDMCQRTTPTSENYLVEICSVLAGIFGTAGVMLFAVQVYATYPPGEGPFGACRKKLFWAWGLQLVGSLVALVSAILIGYSRVNNRGRSERKMRVAAFKESAPVGLNPYFVSRCTPAVRILPVIPSQRDSNA